MTKKELFKTAVEVFGSKKAAKKWFDSKQVIFGGKKPLKYAKELGRIEIEKILKRMEHGIPHEKKNGRGTEADCH
jgi:uncharacterized protein (DUF2384 family)